MKESEVVPQRTWLTPAEAAIYLGVSVATLSRWRSLKTGPRVAAPAPRLIRYAKTDLDAFLTGSSQPARSARAVAG